MILFQVIRHEAENSDDESACLYENNTVPNRASIVDIPDDASSDEHIDCHMVVGGNSHLEFFRHIKKSFKNLFYLLLIYQIFFLFN